MSAPSMDPAPAEVQITTDMPQAPSAPTSTTADTTTPAAPIDASNLQKAKEFLVNPKVKPTALGRKVNFLKSKGMNTAEIHRAFADVGQKKTVAEIENAANNVTIAPPASTPQAAPQTHHHHQPAPTPPPAPTSDWKDYFIGATLATASLLGVKAVASHYLDIDVRLKDGSKRKKKLSADANRELPPVPASHQKVIEIEAKVAQLEESMKNASGGIESAKKGEEKLNELVKSSESMLKKNAENISTLARLEGKARMQDRLTERITKLETANTTSEQLSTTLKTTVGSLAKTVEAITKAHPIPEEDVAAPETEVKEGEDKTPESKEEEKEKEVEKEKEKETEEKQ